MKKLTLLLCTILAALGSRAFAADNSYLYKVTLVQAAPGKLTELIELNKARFPDLKSAGDETPLWIRHSQGDHWDLMILYPMGSYTDYYQSERIARRSKAESRTAKQITSDVAWQGPLRLSADGLRLGGHVGCGGTLRADETADTVTITLHVGALGPGMRTCALVDVEVRLASPLGDRAVVDAVTGRRVRVVR